MGLVAVLEVAVTLPLVVMVLVEMALGAHGADGGRTGGNSGWWWLLMEVDRAASKQTVAKGCCIGGGWAGQRLGDQTPLQPDALRIPNSRGTKRTSS